MLLLAQSTPQCARPPPVPQQHASMEDVNKDKHWRKAKVQLNTFTLALQECELRKAWTGNIKQKEATLSQGQ